MAMLHHLLHLNLLSFAGSEKREFPFYVQKIGLRIVQKLPRTIYTNWFPPNHEPTSERFKLFNSNIQLNEMHANSVEETLFYGKPRWDNFINHKQTVRDNIKSNCSKNPEFDSKKLAKKFHKQIQGSQIEKP